METKYNDIAAENQALRKQIRKLTKELATEHAIAETWKQHYYNAKNENTGDRLSLKLWKGFVETNCPEWLDVFNALCAEPKAAPKAVANSGCKVISMNPLNR